MVSQKYKSKLRNIYTKKFKLRGNKGELQTNEERC